MIKLLRTNSKNQDFAGLVKHLDANLSERDGADHSFYAPFNTVDEIRHVVVAHKNGEPMGCGAIKEYSSDTMEIKRMYTLPGGRGKGIATSILKHLELWAGELGYKKCVLETGKRQPEAIALYQKNGYRQILNYGPYAGIENSVCFGKELK